jgi:SAM-dependent methyltransferase
MSVTPTVVVSTDSYVQTRERFGLPTAAQKYPDEYQNTWKDRAELRAIFSGLRNVPAGARVLDLPCGSGRLTRHLIRRGYQVTAADASAAMVDRARAGCAGIVPFASAAANAISAPRFLVRDVMRPEFEPHEFDAVVCNRLFHHFSEPETRRRALAALAGICSGLVVVSFFNSFALDALKFRLRWWWRGAQPVDRIPIPLKTMVRDCDAAGLALERTIATRWGISPLWYLVLRSARTP